MNNWQIDYHELLELSDPPTLIDIRDDGKFKEQHRYLDQLYWIILLCSLRFLSSPWIKNHFNLQYGNEKCNANRGTSDVWLQ